MADDTKGSAKLSGPINQHKALAMGKPIPTPKGSKAPK